ncbi:DUF2716 domain-containing protein (plasmid) [Streptosporangium sp. NBC_01495]|uniref:DUF2716 domain-containing protein n=1 Tax=Streptosporangium sp. NBC_01495 TaxID=2903899 RepID=UPI002E32C559|nr:DUF2716 domain-containing protein [Streptosporangium sp. NBC_01495]
MIGVAEKLLAAYENQLRGLVPQDLPWGIVVERDGPLVRTHYGTHGTVDHAGLAHDDLAELIRRQQEVFAARHEPIEWKVHSHDAPLLAESLRAAGFVPGPERTLLVADIDGIPSPETLRSGIRIQPLDEKEERLRRMAAAAPEQRRPLAELEADGTARRAESEMKILAMVHDGRILDALWVERVDGTDFAAIGGITGPRPALFHAAGAWAKRHHIPPALSPRMPRHLVAEAPDALVPAHVAAGFHEIARVSTYRWAPAGEPARDRPAKQLLSDPEHDKIWKRFETRFDVTYETADRGIAEPPASATWHLDAVERQNDPLLAEVEAIVARGLRAVARPGDRLYRLKWYISGSRVDPTRVGGPGQPRWMSYAYLVDEHVIQVTEDLRMGTFGNWRESSLCVFGDELLAHVDEDLTDLLGTVLRRGGRPVGNIWSFGP